MEGRCVERREAAAKDEGSKGRRKDGEEKKKEKGEGASSMEEGAKVRRGFGGGR